MTDTTLIGNLGELVKKEKNLMKEIDELFCNRIADKDIGRWLRF